MKHSTLCARALLDHAIQERDNRFFVEHFGERIEQYSLTDYDKLLSNLTSRIRFNILSRGVLLEDVPPMIRELFVHGASVDNVQHFYPLSLDTLNKYRSVCLAKRLRWPNKQIPRKLLPSLAQMSKYLDRLTATEIVELARTHQISVRRLMREVVGEL